MDGQTPAVTFELVVGDLTAASEFANTQSARRSRWWVRLAMFSGSIGATGACLAGAGALTPATAIVATILTAIFVVIYTSWLWPDPGTSTRRHFLRQGQKISSPRRTCALEIDGFRMTHEFGESFIRWTGFNRVVRTGRHLILFTRQGNAIPIPRRAFASDELFDAYAAVANARAVVDADARATGGFPVLPVAARSGPSAVD